MAENAEDEAGAGAASLVAGAGEPVLVSTRDCATSGDCPLGAAEGAAVFAAANCALMVTSLS